MWNLPPSDTVLHLLSYVALTAQAMTAALAAGRRSMDWAGVCMLGCITALGGGTIRDVLLGHYPLVWVQNPSYLALTAIAAFATILIARIVHRASREVVACRVRAVAGLGGATDVDDDRIAFLDDSIGQLVMGRGAVGTRADDHEVDRHMALVDDGPRDVGSLVAALKTAAAA